MKLCLSSLSLQFYAFKSNFDFTFSKPNQAMLPYEIERIVCVCKRRVARDEEDEGMGFILEGPREEYYIISFSFWETITWSKEKI